MLSYEFVQIGSRALVGESNHTLEVNPMTTRGEVLVAIMNNPGDFAIARDHHWYRIPVPSAQKWLDEGWPPRWLALYQTKVFGREAHSINYYATVRAINRVTRRQLFPDQPGDSESSKQYYQLVLGPLQRLPSPIFSRRLRRIVFIATTWEKFTSALEINDLFDESPLEDRLWAALKRWNIQAERQEFVLSGKQQYALDFAIYCIRGCLDIEADGDTWHANPGKAAQDNRRDNALKILGWQVLRFTTGQILNELAEYCVPTVVATIKILGGGDEGGVTPRENDLAFHQDGFSQKGCSMSLPQAFREPEPRCPDARSPALSSIPAPAWKRLRPRAGKRWTPEEDGTLLHEFDAGLSLEAIAGRLGRGVFAAEVRLHKLGRDAAARGARRGKGDVLN
jgi:very-short-patch-repair endonuclease